MRRLSAPFAVALLIVGAASWVSCKAKEPLQHETPTPGSAASAATEAAVRVNLALLRSEDPAERSQGAFRLARMGPVARGAVPALIDALEDPHPVVRKNAISALEEMGPDASAAAAPLRGLLEDGDADIRLRAELALRRVEHDDRVADAVGRLGDADDSVRLQAAEDLLMETPDARAAVPGLIALLNDGNPKVRAIAVMALGRMAFVEPGGYWTVIEALNKAVDDPHPVVKAEAAKRLMVVRAVLDATDAVLRGDVDGTIARLTEILRVVPDEVGAHDWLANLYLGKGSYDAAIASYDRVLELLPRHALAFLGRGEALMAKGLTEDALADLNRALFLDGGLAEVFWARAQLYTIRRENDLALEELDAWLRSGPDSEAQRNAYILEALIYSVTERYERSCAAADRALELGPPRAAAHYFRAVALEKLGREREAAQAYRAFAETALEAADVKLGVDEAWRATRRRLGYPTEEAGAGPAPGAR